MTNQFPRNSIWENEYVKKQKTKKGHKQIQRIEITNDALWVKTRILIIRAVLDFNFKRSIISSLMSYFKTEFLFKKDIYMQLIEIKI